MIRTRFAPSPTGYMHVGNLRTALFTYLLAKSQPDGRFILRIEDTDQEREVPGAVELIYKTLREVGLNYDEGPDVGGDYGRIYSPSAATYTASMPGSWSSWAQHTRASAPRSAWTRCAPSASSAARRSATTSTA